ncbi:MAG: hypothetical protein WAN48_01610, partial [Actinomycetes bacterium]
VTVRVVHSQGKGWVSLQPTGALSGQSVLAYSPAAGRVRNFVIVPVGEGGQITVKLHGASADVGLGVVGWTS